MLLLLIFNILLYIHLCIKVSVGEEIINEEEKNKLTQVTVNSTRAIQTPNAGVKWKLNSIHHITWDKKIFGDQLLSPWMTVNISLCQNFQHQNEKRLLVCSQVYKNIQNSGDVTLYLQSKDKPLNDVDKKKDLDKSKTVPEVEKVMEWNPCKSTVFVFSNKNVFMSEDFQVVESELESSFKPEMPNLTQQATATALLIMTGACVTSLSCFGLIFYIRRSRKFKLHSRDSEQVFKNVYGSNPNSAVPGSLIPAERENIQSFLSKSVAAESNHDASKQLYLPQFTNEEIIARRKSLFSRLPGQSEAGSLSLNTFSPVFEEQMERSPRDAKLPARSSVIINKGECSIYFEPTVGRLSMINGNRNTSSFRESETLYLRKVQTAFYNSTAPCIVLEEGDIVVIKRRFSNGWCHGANMNTGKSGLFPYDCIDDHNLPTEFNIESTETNDDPTKEIYPSFRSERITPQTRHIDAAFLTKKERNIQGLETIMNACLQLKSPLFTENDLMLMAERNQLQDVTLARSI